jgi:putative ABC transport system permease protein
MLLARSAAREREVTIRAALGASRGRIVQQLVTESLLLGIAGGALGLGLAAGGIRILLALGGSGLPRANEIGVDLRVVVFTILVSITTGLTFGLMPAMRSSRAKLADSLREGTHGAAGSGRQRRLRDVLVASELALALILLTGAGLAIRTFIALRNIDPGFRPRGIVTMTVWFTGTAEGSPGAREAFVRQLLERVRALPGVRRASAVNHVPIVGDIWGLPFFIEGRPGPKPGDVPSAAYRVVLPGYFGVMGIRLLAGHDVMASDRAGAPRVVIVNEYLAHTYWPGESAIGKRIALERPGANTDWLTVIGVSKNVVRSDWSAPPAEEIYVPWLQEGHYLSGMGGEVGYVTLVVRANCGSAGACHPSALVPVLRHVIWSLDRNLAVSDVWTLDRVVEAGTSRSRFTLLLLVTFAAVALVLAAVGVYGVMSYTVSRRRHEIGVRIALGAAPGSIVSMIVREGMVVVGIGGAIGIAGAFALTRSMASLLYSITPLDPITFLTVSFILTMTALLATYVPAQSAARSDPLRALRAE